MSGDELRQVVARLARLEAWAQRVAYGYGPYRDPRAILDDTVAEARALVGQERRNDTGDEARAAAAVGPCPRCALIAGAVVCAVCERDLAQERALG